MWVITRDGFFSAVAHRDQPDDLMVRARVRGDLDRAFPGVPVQGPDHAADYPYRIVIAKPVFGAYLARSAVAVDYDNFKAQVRDPHRHDVYMRVWAVLRDLTFRRRHVAPRQIELYADQRPEEDHDA